MRSRSLRVSPRASIALASATFLIAGVAAASWTANGTGNAKAQAGRLEAVTAAPATPTAPLFPGGTGDVGVALTNPNPVAMTVSSIAGDGPITSSSAACDEAGHGVTFTDQTGTWEIAKGAALTVNLPDAVAMSLDSADACQGATFTIPVTVTASVSGQGGGGVPTTTTSTTTQPAQFIWTPANHNFGITEVGTSSNSQQFVLRNVGGASAAVEIGSLGGFDFNVLQNSCSGATLAANQACGVTLNFRPQSTGFRQGQLSARPAGGVYATATVAGEGRMRATLSISPPSANYGTVPVGNESTPIGFQVTNQGGVTANNVAAQLGGIDYSSFVVKQNTCPSQLAPGTSCTVVVSFRPTRTGSHQGQLAVSYLNSAGPTSVLASLSGTA